MKTKYIIFNNIGHIFYRFIHYLVEVRVLQNQYLPQQENLIPTLDNRLSSNIDPSGLPVNLCTETQTERE